MDVSYGCIGANEEKMGCTFAIIIGLGVLLQLFFKKGVFLLFHSSNCGTTSLLSKRARIRLPCCDGGVFGRYK